jgi:hypothetical protein
MMPPGASSFRQYLDQWLVLQRSNGFQEVQDNYWIKGLPRAPQRPRWNLIDALFTSASK